MTWRRALAAAVAGGGLLACQSFGGSPRKGTEGACGSDRECLYGLVCRGAPAGQSGERRCVYERYSRCAVTRDCLAGRTCRAGYCEVECIVDRDCAHSSREGVSAALDAGAAPLHCLIGECKAAERERPCLIPADCESNEECMAGRCEEQFQARCRGDADCVTNQRCFAGHCG